MFPYSALIFPLFNCYKMVIKMGSLGINVSSHSIHSDTLGQNCSQLIHHIDREAPNVVMTRSIFFLKSSGSTFVSNNNIRWQYPQRLINLLITLRPGCAMRIFVDPFARMAKSSLPLCNSLFVFISLMLNGRITKYNGRNRLHLKKKLVYLNKTDVIVIFCIRKSLKMLVWG